jgi:hypothetical protein
MAPAEQMLQFVEPADGTNAAIKTRDLGTSRWQLADKATLPRRAGERGQSRSRLLPWRGAKLSEMVCVWIFAL